MKRIAPHEFMNTKHPAQCPLVIAPYGYCSCRVPVHLEYLRSAAAFWPFGCRQYERGNPDSKNTQNRVFLAAAAFH
ncbi:hypothetical protein [Sulfurimicrobium lacus]|uniref:hypothetical protein n=1 Tax=Sulfurimicrobium lacus TaxID=2715678 RepID=UPI001565C994|nr:hypothetical protein [Sulfurimicrobium lacus]